MVSPGELERGLTLRTAVERLDELRVREALAGDATSIDAQESLELLALIEVVIAKASYGRQSTVRTARSAGASWSQIGHSMGTSKQSAWEAHNRWIDEQVRLYETTGFEGLDDIEARRARSSDDQDPPRTSRPDVG